MSAFVEKWTSRSWLRCRTPHAGEDSYLQGNRDYQDLRGFDWDDVVEALAREKALIARIEAASDLDEEAETIEEERLEDFSDPLWGLDLGVASAVLALSAKGCVPFSSCNAGAFGGTHSASHPVIAFYMPQGARDEVLALAEQASVGLVLDSHGRARLYTGDASRLLDFAEQAASQVRNERV